MQKMLTTASRGLGLLLKLSRLGCRKRTMICILVTVVMARTLYGVECCEVMLPTKGVEKLKKILHRAVRFVTGCLRSTNLKRLYHEADTPQLEEHIRYKVSRTYERFKLSPHIPAHRLVANHYYCRWSHLAWVGHNTGVPGLNDYYRQQTFEEPNPVPYELPPWCTTKSLSFTFSRDKDEAKYFETKLPADDTKIYTDGSIRFRSKTYLTHSGAAVIMVNKDDVRSFGYGIPVAASSYRTEQIALRQAMMVLLQTSKDTEGLLPTARTHILTDSMSVMQALEQGPHRQRSRMNAQIWAMAMDLEKTGVHINVQYVPAHMDVHYNDQADKLAKQSPKCRNVIPKKNKFRLTTPTPGGGSPDFG
eukprot:TRINITY_DN13504_c0_g1_i2.p1 TRINITY_DN13504_c0_g1~~TRINITY_DN13504_c0_g1_i2.p1  ORF type:complete len:362 (-),score=21.60 TRINITY_DN13504_c0_g1_i2:109-1194(-)